MPSPNETITASPTTLLAILSLRESYRAEMNCQIIHDSLHVRPGWTESYLLAIGDVVAGYGSVAVGGPWKGKPTIFEFYVGTPHRARMFDLFSALLNTTGVHDIETQSNDPLLTVMLQTFADNVTGEAILFHDQITTTLAMPGAVFRHAAADDKQGLFPHRSEPEGDWVVEMGGAIIATGGILFHYNRPYGDIYMEVAEPFRRQGIGSYLVQELKRICYEQGSVPAARCNRKNVASRKTLQKAGFVPCGHIVTGSILPATQA